MKNISDVAGSFGIAALAQTKEPATLANGKRLFERNGCYQCHGY